MESAKEKENKKLNDEILELLSQPTAKVPESMKLVSFVDYQTF